MSANGVRYSPDGAAAANTSAVQYLRRCCPVTKRDVAVQTDAAQPPAVRPLDPAELMLTPPLSPERLAGEVAKLRVSQESNTAPSAAPSSSSSTKRRPTFADSDRRFRMQYKSRYFLCGACWKSVHCCGSLKKHLATAHRPEDLPARPAVCLICSGRAKTPQDLDVHLKTSHIQAAEELERRRRPNRDPDDELFCYFCCYRHY